MISDGEAVLPNLARAATREPVRHTLDRFHLSVRIAADRADTNWPFRSGPPRDTRRLQAAQSSIERVRQLLGTAGRVRQTTSWSSLRATRATSLSGAEIQETTRDLMRHCSDLRGYVHNNRHAIVNYHRRYLSDRPLSTSRAEGCVDEIANARMSKRQRMRWSPKRSSSRRCRPSRNS